MLYVMWKNVGRRIAHHASSIKSKFQLHGVIFGPLLGISATIIGICIFLVYQIQLTSSSSSHQAFILYYSYYIVLLPVMAIGALVGTLIHGLEERELDTLKNPTRSLDVILLMGTALGQIGMSYFSIVAIVATNPKDLLNSIIITYSVSIIIQHITQNIFIIEGLHRQPVGMDEGSSHTKRSIRGLTSTQSSPHEHMIDNQGSVSSIENTEIETKGEKSDGRSPKVFASEMKQDIRRVSQAYIQTYNHLNWKRKGLKEISSFLIMCNIVVST